MGRGERERGHLDRIPKCFMVVAVAGEGDMPAGESTGEK